MQNEPAMLMNTVAQGNWPGVADHPEIQPVAANRPIAPTPPPISTHSTLLGVTVALAGGAVERLQSFQPGADLCLEATVHRPVVMLRRKPVGPVVLARGVRVRLGVRITVSLAVAQLFHEPCGC